MIDIVTQLIIFPVDAEFELDDQTEVTATIRNKNRIIESIFFMAFYFSIIISVKFSFAGTLIMQIFESSFHDHYAFGATDF